MKYSLPIYFLDWVQMRSVNILPYVAAILLATILVVSGWMARGWYNDSVDLAAEKAVKKTEIVVAKQLEDKLASLKANERIVEREKIKVLEKPVYSNVCLDESGVMLINQAKRGASQPASEVPAPSRP